MYRGQGDGPVDAIELDPFASPHRPRTPQRGSAQESPAPDRSPAAPDPQSTDFKSAVNGYERQLLTRALAVNRYNQRTTADALGLTYDQLRHALRRHDLIGTVA